MTSTALVTGVLLPMVLAAIGSAVGWKLWRRDDTASDDAARAKCARIGTCVGLVAGFIAASVTAFGPPRPLGELMRQSVQHWFVYIGLVAAVFSVVRCCKKWLPGTRAFGAGLACAAVAWAITSPLARNNPDYFSSEMFIKWMVITSICLVVMVASFDGLSRRAGGAGAAGVLACWALVTSPCLVLWGLLHVGQVAGALAAVACIWVVLGFWRRRFSLSHGAASAFALLVGACIATAFIYGIAIDNPTLRASGGVLVVSSLAWLIADIPPIRKKLSVRGAAIVRILATLVVAGVAMGLTMSVVDIRDYLDFL